jgi:cell wall-associated NlpC family hydrolase
VVIIKRVVMLMKKFLTFLIGGLFISNVAFSWKDNEVKSHFPIEHYFTIVSSWISPDSEDYNISLPQSELWQSIQVKNFYQHYFGNESPWDSLYIDNIYHDPTSDNLQTHDLKSIETKILHDKSNDKYLYDVNTHRYDLLRAKTENEMGYDGFDQHAKPHSDAWIKQLEANINLPQFDKDQNYNEANRAIAIDNLKARVLPTDDIYALNYKLPGEGKSFDYLQMSAIWAGTPLYILAKTKDQVWSLVASPDVNAWVRSKGIVQVNNNFIEEWRKRAAGGLIAITHTEIPVLDQSNNKELFKGYIGAIFPLYASTYKGFQILVPPSADDGQQPVRPHYAFLSNQEAALIPLKPMPHNFVNIMNQLLNRHYGWGNFKFRNDCSGEIKNFYAPFGIWLPRNSASQVNTDASHPATYTLGKVVDYGTVNGIVKTPQERIQYLREYGHKFTTIVFIEGHVFMYVGNYYPDPTHINANNSTVLTYQNIWGLRPTEAAIKNGDHDRRAVIGKSVLFPLLPQYPEDLRLGSLAAKPVFKVMYLDMPPMPFKQLQFSTWLDNTKRTTDLAALMLPEEVH